MSPGIGHDRRLNEKCISLATSNFKRIQNRFKEIKTLETKYDDDAGDWYVALGWEDKRAC